MCSCAEDNYSYRLSEHFLGLPGEPPVSQPHQAFVYVELQDFAPVLGRCVPYYIVLDQDQDARPDSVRFQR